MRRPGSEPAWRGARSVGSLWLQQRSRSWLWAALFLVVVLALVVLVGALDPAPAAGGQPSGQSFSHHLRGGAGAGGVND